MQSVEGRRDVLQILRNFGKIQLLHLESISHLRRTLYVDSFISQAGSFAPAEGGSEGFVVSGAFARFALPGAEKEVVCAGAAAPLLAVGADGVGAGEPFRP